MDKANEKKVVNISELIIFPDVLLLSFWVFQKNFLLFHPFIEICSIVISVLIFVVSLSTYKYANNDYFYFLGIAFLFVGVIDFVHTLAYKGMDVFLGITANISTQLGIAARYVQAISLLIVLIFIVRKSRRVYG